MPSKNNPMTPQEIKILYMRLKRKGLSDEEITAEGIKEVRRRRDARIKERWHIECTEREEAHRKELEENRRKGTGPGSPDREYVLRQQELDAKILPLCAELWQKVWDEDILLRAKGVK